VTAASRGEEWLHWLEEDVFSSTGCHRSPPGMDLQEDVGFCLSRALKVARYQAGSRWTDFSR